ncbi:uncharacterized protein [Penaeus vannamei]|uniref:uncharacterized protein n=1 Tax=Penaeus vannamei TaxID=6689 RepID=UPI00387F7231
MLEATDACRAARLRGDWDLSRSQVRRSVKVEKGQFIRILAGEAEDHFLVNDLLNLDAGNIEIPLPEPPISEDPPSVTVVKGAISKLKSGKAAGICGIPTKLVVNLCNILLRYIRDHAEAPEAGAIWIHSCIDQIPPPVSSGMGCLQLTSISSKPVYWYYKYHWEIQRMREISTSIIELLANLYTGTECAVNLIGALATLGNIKVINLDFADDVAILSLWKH